MLSQEKLLNLTHYLRQYEGPPIRIMEVCGSHTRAIEEYGIRQILSPAIELVSGPGCPICVTPDAYLKEIQAYGKLENWQIICFGDLLRLPQMQGIEHHHMVYSPIESLKLAKQEPGQQFIFIGIAFETTAPLIAWVIRQAYEAGIGNLKIWCGLKRMPPVIEQLSKEKVVDGYLYPGHVAAILGELPFEQISKNNHIPGVIAGFKPEELLLALGKLVNLISKGEHNCINAYPQVVRREGNQLAQKMMAQVFESWQSLWRGLGKVTDSGYRLKEPYHSFEVLPSEKLKDEVKVCICDLVISGKSTPFDCPLWGKTCTPDAPRGPCMVSAEGACAIYYQFKRGESDETGY